MNFRSIIIFLIYLIFSQDGNAQSGLWTWVAGDTLYNGAPVYGTQGIPSPAVTPGSLYEPCEWKDQNGNLWLYGGYTLTGAYADLWKFDVSTNQWTWVKGPGTVTYAGSYGVMGVPNITNNPSSRFCALTWVDNNNDLWMFGGSSTGIDKTDDLWRYNIATNTWTWIKGTLLNLQPPVYGTKGVPGTFNTPGALYETTSSWVDATNNLWFFGGYLHNNQQLSNALWKFDTGTNEWTWMSGNQWQSAGSYGTKGVASVNNYPGARQAYSNWKDASGNFYFFGGLGYDSDSLRGNLDDMWRYNPATNEWTWLHGTDTADGTGNFGTKFVASPSNLPPSRLEHRSCFTDDCGNFWLFAGIAFYQAAPIEYFNDLWKYDPTQNLWIWMGGDSIVDQFSVWGNKNVAAATNKPGSRSGAVTWYAGDSVFYMFGGFFASSGVKLLGDMWKFKFDTTCTASAALPVSDFAVSDSQLCVGQCFNLIDQSSNAPLSWNWTVAGPQVFNYTVQNPGPVCPSLPGNYTVSLVVCNTAGCDTLIQAGLFQVFDYPIINLGLDTIICDDDSITISAGNGYTSYLWNNGATDASITVYVSGTYWVDVINGECLGTDTVIISTQSCALPQISVNISDTLICFGSCVDYLDLTINNPISWQWTFTGAQTATSTLQNPSGICYANSGVFPVTLIACNQFGCDSVTYLNAVSVDSIAPLDLGIDTTLCQGDTLWLDAGPVYNSYSWSTGESTQVVSVTTAGNYTVVVTSGTCTASDTIIVSVQSCIYPVAAFSLSDTVFCEKQCLDFTDLSTGNVTSWQWLMPGAQPDTSTLQNPQNICYNNYGVFDVTLIVCNQFGCDTIVFSNFVQVFPNPVDSIWLLNDTLFSLPAFSYQWYEVSGGIIPGATLPYFVPQTSGDYYCVIFDSIGCIATSNTVQVVISGMLQANSHLTFNIYPNPSNGEFVIEVSDAQLEQNEIFIYDFSGKLVFEDKLNSKKHLMRLKLADGVYQLKIRSKQMQVVHQITIIN